MNRDFLFSLLLKIIFILLFSFFLFILSLNVFRFLKFVVDINTVINKTQYDDEIPVLINEYNNFSDDDYKKYNQNKAHSALELNFENQIGKLDMLDWEEGINFLIIGSDKKKLYENKARADVIIVLRINAKGKILSISIPRDTLIETTDRNGKFVKDKIGHSMYWGGVENLKNNVERLINGKIYKILIIDNFRSFEAFLAILGGVSIDKKLQGKVGIQWIRNRNFVFGDIERCKRQQIFIKKAISKIWKISNEGNFLISMILFNSIKKLISTDISEDDFLRLLYLLKINNFDPEKDVYISIVDGKFDTYVSPLLHRENLSCWVMDTKSKEHLEIFFSNSDLSIIKNLDITYLNLIKLSLKNKNKNVK